MKITLTQPGATPSATPKVRTLGDDATREFITGMLPTGKAEVQTSSPIRSAAKRKFSRDNVETQFTFQVSRNHATNGEALVFIIDEFAAVLGAQGTVAITETGLNGGTTRVIEDAVVSGLRCVDHKGVMTIMEYSIEGGAFTVPSSN